MSEMEWVAPSVIIDLEEQEANCGNGHGLEVGQDREADGQKVGCSKDRIRDNIQQMITLMC